MAKQYCKTSWVNTSKIVNFNIELNEKNRCSLLIKFKLIDCKSL